MAEPGRRAHLAALGLAEDASREAIKDAYRRIARDNHPDRNPGDAEAEARFRRAAEAYRALTSPEPTEPAGGESFAASAASAASAAYDAVFGPEGALRRERGADLVVRLSLDLEASAIGGPRTVEVPRRVHCPGCGGTGARSAGDLEPCPACDGAGTRRRKLGFFERTERCPDCGGRGTRILAPCSTCGGATTVEELEEVTVKIPPGVQDGTRLKIAGGGAPGRAGGPPGDLVVVVEIPPHPLFAREGRDVVVELPLAFSEAVLGTKVDVPTLDGVVRMRVPPGTPSGKEFRIEGRGFEGGHQRVRIRIEVPTELSDEARAALEVYAELEDAQGSLPARAAFRARTAERARDGG